MILADLVEVQHDLLVGIQRAVLAGQDAILQPLLCARVIEVVALAHRDREIGLLDAREHLVVQLLLQRLGVLQERLAMDVLGLEMSGDRRCALLAQPVVIIDPRVAVNGDLVRVLGGYRRCHRLDIGHGGLLRRHAGGRGAPGQRDTYQGN